MLEVVSVRKRFGSFVLGDVSLTVNEGEYFVLLGPSGVGKTVLMEIVAGLVRPDGGKVLWDGADITAVSPEHRGFGLVYQDYALFPHLTVKQNIVYGLKAASVDNEKIRQQLEALTEMLHIGQFLNRHPQKLSGGQQQRVALARALVVKPKLLLLDEPLSACDVNTRSRLRKELKRINVELNIPVLHVTHDPQEAIALGDRIGVMLDSRIRQAGTPTELFRAPTQADVAKFLGMKNILPVSRVEGDECFVYDHSIYVSSADDSTSYIWIKPEEILISAEAFDSSARNQFKCRVTEVDHHSAHPAVKVTTGQVSLTALITYRSLEKLKLETGDEVYVTFKSSAVHCF